MLSECGGETNKTKTAHFNVLCITARKRSLGQGNVFTLVCHSVHGGVSLSQHASQVTCQGGLCPEEGDLCPGALCLRGCLCLRVSVQGGVSVQGESLSGVSVRETPLIR